MSNQNQNTARAARVEAAKSARAEALAAHRAALARVREAKSAANRERHAARPVPVSAHAVSAVIGKPLADGASARATVGEEHGARFVSLRPLIGKRVTFTREGDRYAASVPAGKSDAGKRLAAAEREAVSAGKRLASARAAVKRATVKPSRKPRAAA